MEHGYIHPFLVVKCYTCKKVLDSRFDFIFNGFAHNSRLPKGYFCSDQCAKEYTPEIISSGVGTSQQFEKGRWWGKQYCPHAGEPCIDGCYFCGRPVGALNGDHNHTKVSLSGEPDAYSCVCEGC